MYEEINGSERNRTNVVYFLSILLSFASSGTVAIHRTLSTHQAIWNNCTLNSSISQSYSSIFFFLISYSSLTPIYVSSNCKMQQTINRIPNISMHSFTETCGVTLFYRQHDGLRSLLQSYRCVSLQMYQQQVSSGEVHLNIYNSAVKNVDTPSFVCLLL